MDVNTRSPLSIRMCEGLILAAIAAHSQHPRTPDLAFRKFDGRTPVALHAVQCATTILQEVALPENVRDLGFQVLLFHDLMKCTTADFPVSVSEDARRLVKEMTFSSLEQEIECLGDCSEECALYLLYSKLGNLWDDAEWMSSGMRMRYLRHVLNLADLVELQQGEVGKKLRIIPVVRCLCAFRAA